MSAPGPKLPKKKEPRFQLAGVLRARLEALAGGEVQRCEAAILGDLVALELTIPPRWWVVSTDWTDALVCAVAARSRIFLDAPGWAGGWLVSWLGAASDAFEACRNLQALGVLAAEWPPPGQRPATR